jgi:hypothetical protein
VAGYSEGTGLITARNLAAFIGMLGARYPEILNGVKIAPRIITITGSYRPVDNYYISGSSDSTYDEVTGPLQALVSAWRARTLLLSEGVAIDDGTGTLTRAEFDNEAYVPLPLGWQISPLWGKFFDVFSGQPQDCDRKKGSSYNLVNANNCLIQNIIDDLRQGSQEMSVPDAAGK